MLLLQRNDGSRVSGWEASLANPQSFVDPCFLFLMILHKVEVDSEFFQLNLPGPARPLQLVVGLVEREEFFLQKARLLASS